MNKAYQNQRVQASILELFQSQREEEESQRLSIAELVRAGARIMLETALEVEVEEFLGRSRYQRGGGIAMGRVSETSRRSPDRSPFASPRFEIPRSRLNPRFCAPGSGGALNFRR